MLKHEWAVKEILPRQSIIIHKENKNVEDWLEIISARLVVEAATIEGGVDQVTTEGFATLVGHMVAVTIEVEAGQTEVYQTNFVAWSWMRFQTNVLRF